MRNWYFALGLIFYGLISLCLAWGQIYNIDEFLENCPTEDPAFAKITNDFKIRRNGVLVTDFSCTGPISQIPVADYSDEIITLQGLRAIYYMDRNLKDPLPWASGSLYDWIKAKINGINISDTSAYSHCCDKFEDGLYFVVTAQDEINREFDRTWMGISGNIGLYAHEVRHVDGYGHVSCCGINNGCDQKYDETDLTAFGIQWWLNQAWLTGQINVGIGCLDIMRVRTIANWHISSCNSTIDRFCDSPPPTVSMPAHPGGICGDCGYGHTVTNPNPKQWNQQPNETISGSFNYEVWNPTGGDTSQNMMLVAIQDDSGNWVGGEPVCVYGPAIPGQCKENGYEGLANFSGLVAPSAPGTYDVVSVSGLAYNCEDLINKFKDGQDLPNMPLGLLTVSSNDSGEGPGEGSSGGDSDRCFISTISAH